MPKPEKRSIVFKDALGGDTSEITPHRPQGITAADHAVAADSVESTGIDEQIEVVLSPAVIEQLNGTDCFRVPVAILDDLRLKSAEKLILVTLCRYADAAGLSSPPSQRVISQCCGMTEYWARETLKALEERGYIKTTADSTFKHRRYQIMNWPQE